MRRLGAFEKKDLLRRLPGEGFANVRELPDGAIVGVRAETRDERLVVYLYVGLTDYSYARRYRYGTAGEASHVVRTWTGGPNRPPGRILPEPL